RRGRGDAPAARRVPRPTLRSEPVRARVAALLERALPRPRAAARARARARDASAARLGGLPERERAAAARGHGRLPRRVRAAPPGARDDRALARAGGPGAAR